MYIYLKAIKFSEDVEVYTVLKDGKLCITKRAKIFKNGFVCPRFLREASIISYLMKPPEYLACHEGKQHIVKLISIHTDNEYIYINMECASDVLTNMMTNNVNYVYDNKEQILVDVSKGLEYIHEMGYNHGDISVNNIALIKNNIDSKYVLIDFGNSYHKDRYHTLELSTFCTM